MSQSTAPIYSTVRLFTFLPKVILKVGQLKWDAPIFDNEGKVSVSYTTWKAFKIHLASAVTEQYHVSFKEISCEICAPNSFMTPRQGLLRP